MMTVVVLSFHGKNLNDYERHGGEKVMFDERDAPSLRQRVAKNLILKLKVEEEREKALNSNLSRDFFFGLNLANNR